MLDEVARAAPRAIKPAHWRVISDISAISNKRGEKTYGGKAARDPSDNNPAAIFIIESNMLLKLPRLK